MIYIFTALYCEAHAFIQYFKLARDRSNPRFQVFCNEETGVRLTVTGTGPVPAAAVVASICTQYCVGHGDFLVNIGVCADLTREQEPAILYLCNRIVEQTTGKTFYPDILYRHSFQEGCVVTGARQLNGYPDSGEIAPVRGVCLYDMEAAAVYQAGAYFFGPHQMTFLKIRSDAGNAAAVSPGQVERLAEQCLEPIAAYIERLCIIGRNEKQRETAWGDKERNYAEQLCSDMHCSRTMSDSVRQHIRYFSLAGIDYESVIRKLYDTGELPCRDKREGKRCFEKLKRRLL